MAWADLASNQMVSYTDAQGGGFTIKPGKTNPGTPQCMTKAQAFDMYYLQTTANTNTVASNQLMRKDYWEAATLLPYSYTLYYWSIADVSLYGFTTGSEACAETVKFITVYSSSSTITAGMGLFYDQYGNNPLYAASYTTVYPYYKLNSSLIRFAINDVETTQGYVVYDVSTCVVSYSHFFSSIGSPTSSGTCFFTTDIELYSSSSSLGPSVVIYTDSDLLTPFFGMDQWYAGDGGKTYLINNSGVITSEYVC